MIIDFHAHTFPDSVCERIIDQMSREGGITHATNGSVGELVSSMRQYGVTYSLNHPVMTRPDQVAKVNTNMIRRRQELLDMGIITFGGLHPDTENYKEEIARLKAAGIPGVKFHPAYQNTELNDIRYKRMIGALSDAGMITIIHAGMDIGFPGHDFSSTAMILEILKDVAPERFVLAHMGGWQKWDDVSRDLAGAPVWFDTAYSLGIVPPRMDVNHDLALQYGRNMRPDAFVSLVRAHGADKVLFGTDSPWQDQGDYIEQLKAAPLTAAEKEQILGTNALSLLRSAGMEL